MPVATTRRKIGFARLKMSIQTMPKRITCWRKFSWPGTISKMPIRKSIARSNWIPSNLSSADSGSKLSINSRALHSKDGTLLDQFRGVQQLKRDWIIDPCVHEISPILKEVHGD